MDEKLKVLFLKHIKESKNTKTIDDVYVNEFLENELKKISQDKKNLLFEKSKNEKSLKKDPLFIEILKEVRKNLGSIYGQFLTQKYKKKYTFIKNKKDLNNLFLLHKSTRERAQDYQYIYKEIFSWYIPKKAIADLGCGFNPLSYLLIEKQLERKIPYFASDLMQEDMEFLNYYFKENNSNGKAINCDLTNEKSFNKIKKEIENCDLIFLFKIIDSLETKKRNSSKTLLNFLQNKKIVVSLSKKSLVSNKQFYNKRNWFFSFLEKNSFVIKKTIETEFETYYCIEKN